MAELELAVTHPIAFFPLFPDQIGILGVDFCVGRETGKNPVSKARIGNK